MRSNIEARALLLVVILAVSPISLARPWSDLPQTPQTARQSFPPTQYIPNHDYDIRHIELDLHFDWEKEQAIGTEIVMFSPLGNLSRIELDAANMTFASVKLRSGTPLKYETDAAEGKLRITLDRAYQPEEELAVVIQYHTNGPPSRQAGLAGGGLRFIKPTPDDPTRPKQIWSQGESEYNHYWFPCYDHPNDFFTSELFATVEKPLSVVSNGKLIETTENTDGTRTFHWKIDQPHASYLTSIVVGEYIPIVAQYEGIPVITNVYPNEVAEGKITAARLAEMVKFFSEKTGVKYPYAKYAQTMVRDFGGGMENISATTQTDNMIHDARTELDQTSDGLQSHELAHQWFGDYLTCRSWSDIWLNESFATYFQAMWDEHKLGHDDFLYLDVKGNQDAYFSAWNRGHRRPIVTKNYANPDAVFDTYAYPRGGAVLHMLRKNLGEENWWRAINYYLRKYAHQPVETEQFRIAIEESTGQSMDWFFDQWLYRMGHPVFQIAQEYDLEARKLTLTIKQVQKADPDSHYPQVALFQIPVEIEIATAKGSRVERVQIAAKEEQRFTFAIDSQPLFVNFDYGDTLIKEVEFQRTTNELLAQMAHDEDVMGRMWALGKVAGRMHDETTPDADRQRISDEVARIVTKDKFWGMRLESAAALAGVPGETVRKALLAGTSDENARVRARVITSLGAGEDASLSSVYRQHLNDQSYGVIQAAAIALGQTRSEGAYEALAKLLDVPSWRDTIRAAALSGLSALGDKRALDLAWKYAAMGNPAGVRAAALRLAGAVGKDDPRTFPLLSQTFGQAFEKRDFLLGSASAEALVTLGDPRGLSLFSEALKKSAGVTQIELLLTEFQNRLRRSVEGPPRVQSQQP